jgi:hypothetical protein
MTRLVAPLALSVVVFAAVSRAGEPAAPLLEPIRYERTGGFVGTRDVVEITPAGDVVVTGRLMGEGKGQLTGEQRARLAGLFADWKSLKPSYPAPPGSADGFQIKLRWGGTEVSANELAPNLPAAFTAARQEIEKIAQEITRK